MRDIQKIRINLFKLIACQLLFINNMKDIASPLYSSSILSSAQSKITQKNKNPSIFLTKSSLEMPYKTNFIQVTRHQQKTQKIKSDLQKIANTTIQKLQYKLESYTDKIVQIFRTSLYQATQNRNSNQKKQQQWHLNGIQNKQDLFQKRIEQKQRIQKLNQSIHPKITSLKQLITLMPQQNIRAYEQKIMACVFVYYGYGFSCTRRAFQELQIPFQYSQNRFKSANNSIITAIIRKTEKISMLDKLQNVQPFYSSQIKALSTPINNHKYSFSQSQSSTIIKLIKILYKFQDEQLSQQQIVDLHRRLINQLHTIQNQKNKTFKSLSHKYSIKNNYLQIDQYWTSTFQKDFLDIYIQLGSVARVKVKMIQKYGTNPILANTFRLRAKFNQLLRHSIRKVQQISMERSVEKCEYLNEHKIKYIQMAKQNMELRKKLLIVYKTDESQIENFNVKQCVSGLNSIANMGNKRKDGLIQASKISFSQS